MTRKEYMEQLSRALEDVEPEVAKDIMEDYEAHFERARESGRSDEEVIEELGSIEEFSEELDAFISGKRTQKQCENAEKENAEESNVEEANTEGGNAEKGNTETPQEAKEHAQENAEEKEEELKRAREEMNRAYEEMMRAKEQLERAAKEQERAAREQERAAKEQERVAGEQERTEKQRHVWGRDPFPGWEGTAQEQERQKQRDTVRREQEMRRNEAWENVAGSVFDSTKNIANNVLKQVTNAMDKAFSGLGDWMNGFEKSGENAADYRRRQENAKYDAEELRGRSRESGRARESSGTSKARGEGRDKEITVSVDYSYDRDYSCDTAEEKEQYMPECDGIVTKEEGIRHIVVDSKSAEVQIRPSKDDMFYYHYINEGSTGSKIIYRCEKRISQDTLTLSIVRDEQARRKNHYSILGGVFEENTDLELELHLPEWIETMEVNGKSGDIDMSDVTIPTLMLKNMSGDITLERVNADKCMAETMSGDATVKNGTFSYVLASSKSGDASAEGVKSDKAAFKSMSGDASAEDSEFDEAAVSSMSGDAAAKNISGKTMSVSSMSGDATAQNLFLKAVKVSAVSGEVNVSNVKADNLVTTTVSGDLDASGLSAGILKASATSGDMSLRGHAEEMNLTNGSGDVIVVENGNTKAYVETRSGEVNFHLKNEGTGFAAKVTTHGDANFRYNDLKMRDVANGIHRYGAEGSSLEIVSVSGDISITD